MNHSVQQKFPQTETITIGRMSYGSASIGKNADGKTLFIEGGVPGDVARVAITKDKGRFAQAEVVEVITPSSERVETPRCTRTCSGCPWRNITYDAQLKFKRSNVVEALVRVGKLNRQEVEEKVKPTHPSPKQWGYRNKIELAVQRDNKNQLLLGYNREHSQEFCPIDCCPVAAPLIQKSPKALKGALRYIEGNEPSSLFRVGVRGSERTGSIEVALWTKPSGFPRKFASQTLTSAMNATSIVRVLADPGKARKIKKVEALSGKGYWEELLLSYRYRTSAPAFFQVNSDQAEYMISSVLQWLKPSPDEFVCDLYSGGGTFSLPLSGTGADVVAVEMLGASVRDLRRNADLNKVEVEICGGDVERELEDLEGCEAVVVDPPRAGLAKGVLQQLINFQLPFLIYISCDPQTLGRDLGVLTSSGYKLVEVQPLDMFPQTYHVETMVLLTWVGEVSF